MSHGLRFQYPARLPAIAPGAADRLREEIDHILDDHAYALALLFDRDNAAPALRGTVSLAVAPATTTTISNSLVATNSLILLTANNLLGAMETPTLFATYAVGVVTLNHTANAGARTFQYLILP